MIMVLVTHNRPEKPSRSADFKGFPHKTCGINEFSTHNRPERCFQAFARNPRIIAPRFTHNRPGPFNVVPVVP
jgi:hypothetical protein